MKTKIPDYCLHRPTGRAYVTFPGKPRRVAYLGEHGSDESKARYQAAISDWLAGRSPETVQQPARATPLREVVQRYLAHADVYYRKRGALTSHVGNIRLALAPLDVDEPADAFDAKALKAYRERLVESGLTRGGCNRRTCIVVKAFRWAASEGLVPESTWRGLAVVETLKRDRCEAIDPDPVEPVAVKRVDAALRYMPPPVAAMVRLQLLTGMRPGEACSMRRLDLDSSRKTWIYRPESHKTEHHDRTRVVPLGPQAQAIVRPFLPLDPAEPLFSPRAWMAVSRPKAVRIYADRYDKDTYAQAIGRACDKAFPHPKLGKVKPSRLTDIQRADLEAWRKAHRWHPNQLRHTYATELRKRYGLEATQVLLGHARADVTQIYAKRDLAAAVKIAAKVG